MAKKTLIGGEKQKAESGKQKKSTKSATPMPKSWIEVIPIGKLFPAAYNPRRTLKPGDAEFDKLERSIRQFGLVDPPVWNRQTGNLVGGHQRLAVLRHIRPELMELSVSVVELPLSQEKALNVALNKIEGAWDQDKLGELLAELNAEMDATVTGFDMTEIDALLAEIEESGKQKTESGGEVVEVGNSYKVIVNCTGEKQQSEVLAMLRRKGIAGHTITRE